MKTSDALLAVLAAAPDKKIEGKKRLQKVVYLLKLAGLEIEADFRLLHYGPYSAALANAADLLSLFGAIEEESKPVGIFGTYQVVYSLHKDQEAKKLPAKYIKLLAEISKFSTVELEVASTIGLFKAGGSSLREATEKTKFMKPSKAVKLVLAKAEQVLEKVENV